MSYTYLVKNKPWADGAGWVVLYSDTYKIKQLACVKDGEWSLVESDRPLPVLMAEGRTIAEKDVARIKEKLILSHDRRVDGENVDGIPVEWEDLR